MPDDILLRGEIEQETARIRRAQRRWATRLLEPAPGEPYLTASLQAGAKVAYRVRPDPEPWPAGCDPAAGPPLVLPYADAAFAHVLVTLPSRQPDSETTVRVLTEVRRVLCNEGRVAVLRWPAEKWMFRRPFWRGYDTLAQWCGEELQADLAEAGFRDVRLRFRPEIPIAAVCATAVSRPAAAYFFPSPLFLNLRW